jgi:hypothetical protein
VFPFSAVEQVETGSGRREALFVWFRVTTVEDNVAQVGNLRYFYPFATASSTLPSGVTRQDASGESLAEYLLESRSHFDRRFTDGNRVDSAVPDFDHVVTDTQPRAFEPDAPADGGAGIDGG